jgi:anti-anti-sigma factor
MQFLITEQNDGSTRHVILQGEFDLASDAALRAAIMAAVTNSSVECVIIDLARVTFLDCSTVGSLVYGRNAAEARGCCYEIRHARGLPLRVLRATGIAVVDKLHS